MAWREIRHREVQFLIPQLVRRSFIVPSVSEVGAVSWTTLPQRSGMLDVNQFWSVAETFESRRLIIFTIFDWGIAQFRKVYLSVAQVNLSCP
jgi:hypothetical protein